MLMGHNPPCLAKNILEHDHQIHKRVTESECSCFRILNSKLLKNMVIKAFVRNGEITVPVDIVAGSNIVTFSCFDEFHVFLYYFPPHLYPTQFCHNNSDSPACDEVEDIQNDFSFQEDGKCHVFYSRITCCRNWDVKLIRAVEIDFTSATQRYIHIPVVISNARQAEEYHYNICHAPEEGLYPVILELQSFFLPTFQCPLCFRIFRTKRDMGNHISVIHADYDMEDTEKGISLKLIHRDRVPSSSIGGIEFYSKAIIDEWILGEKDVPEDSSRGYIDFSTGLMADHMLVDHTITDNPITDNPMADHILVYHPMAEGESDENKSNASSDLCVLNCTRPLFKQAKDNMELVRQVRSEKMNGSKPGTLLIITLRLEPLIKWESDVPQSKTAKKGEKQVKRFKPTDGFIFPACWSKLASSSKERIHGMRKFVFIKKRETLIFNYPLQKYGLLIEREYNELNYSNMLVKHLNQRIKEHLFSKSLGPRIYKLMRAWNGAFIRNLTVEKALIEIISNYGVADETVDLIELLYTRGILNGREIMKILENSGEWP